VQGLGRVSSKEAAPVEVRRFTRDGTAELESHLKRVCAQVRAGIRAIIPRKHLEAIVLGGGYGRGEGGVLRTLEGERPYNDLEFYIFCRGNRLWNERQFQTPLFRLAHALAPQATVEIEFKIDSLERLRRTPVSMFSYDLVAGHRIVLGNEAIFEGCEHHLAAESIPVSEATRLIFNRCTGLLLAKARLRQSSVTMNDADFIGRNLAKAQLALGDALLTARGAYHWSCVERHRWLSTKAAAWNCNSVNDIPPAIPLARITELHALGLEFKLHPRQVLKPAEEFEREHAELTALGQQVWLWLENRRLGTRFENPREYSLSSINKCPETAPWRNRLLHLRTFGIRAALERASTRYPRERLFNSLLLLLGNGDMFDKPSDLRHLQRELRTPATDWPALLEAYKRVWVRYG
jgi:hypothetical protein